MARIGAAMKRRVNRSGLQQHRERGGIFASSDARNLAVGVQLRRAVRGQYYDPIRCLAGIVVEKYRVTTVEIGHGSEEGKL